MRHVRRPLAAHLIVGACLAVFQPVSAAAQETPPTDTVRHVRLFGRVLDATSGTPVTGARLLISNADVGAVSDSLGRWIIELPRADEYLLSIGQLGYATLWTTLPESAPTEFTTVLLEPDPIQLEGLEVLVDRFETRRRFYTGNLRVLDQQRLGRTPGLSLYSVVKANLPAPMYCPDALDQLCSLRRGRPSPVEVCVDDRTIYQPISELESHAATDVYLLEIYDRGRWVRVYTRAFVEGLLATGERLNPVAWGCT